LSGAGALAMHRRQARLIVAGTFARICLADGHPELDRGELDDALLSVPTGKYPSIEELARALDDAKRRP
jgi:hypothetical protein